MSNNFNLAQRIAHKKVAEGHVACWWLGGSGFVFKTPTNTVIYLDPYLSDALKDILGLARGFPSPIDPHEVRADAVISTHWHEDHLDPGSIPIIARNNPDAQFFIPPSSLSRALGWGVRRPQITTLTWGEKAQVKEVSLEATPARHVGGVLGWEVSDAMGVLLHAEGLAIYHSGDTEYDVRLRRLKTREPDVALLCINGITGNMDAHEAALLAWHLKAGIAIPTHHLLWSVTTGTEEETLDPDLFVRTYTRLGGRGRAILPQVGEEIDLITAHPK